MCADWRLLYDLLGVGDMQLVMLSEMYDIQFIHLITLV